MKERDRKLAQRARIRDEFGPLYDEVSQILFDVDSVGINFEHNTV